MVMWIYLAPSVVGAVWTWFHNLRFMRAHGSFSIATFVAEGFANPAAASLGADISVAALAGLVLVVVEGRRQRRLEAEAR
jgi:Na+/proline symporter